MQEMTPEERFSKLQNALDAIAENQTRFDEQLQKLGDKVDKLGDRVDKLYVSADKHDSAIRDLIVVSRTLLDAQLRTTENIDRMSIKVDKIADYLEKFLRRGPNGDLTN